MTAPNKSKQQNHSHDIANNCSKKVIDHLSNIRIVMVNTTLPANIGSAARAMHTMGLSQLFVVKPKHIIDDTSFAHAAGAQAILQNCQVVHSIEESLKGCELVFAASSRSRHIPRPVVNPDQAAQIVLKYTENASQEIQTAILFGREDRGLTNDELAMADYHIQIDANPKYPVLNVASAVQVIASFFYSRFLQHDTAKSAENKDIQSIPQEKVKQDLAISIILRQIWDTPAITHEQKTNLKNQILSLMQQLELVDSASTKNLRDLPIRLSRLISRVQLDQKEYELINSILARIKLKI